MMSHSNIFQLIKFHNSGIPVEMIEFGDNRPVLDMLLSRPLGLLALLGKN